MQGQSLREPCGNTTPVGEEHDCHHVDKARDEIESDDGFYVGPRSLLVHRGTKEQAPASDEVWDAEIASHDDGQPIRTMLHAVLSCARGDKTSWTECHATSAPTFE